MFITGTMTHMCVDATLRAAIDLGFACTLVHDGPATRDLSFAGEQVPVVRVQAAFTAALGSVCDEVIGIDEVARTLTKKVE